MSKWLADVSLGVEEIVVKSVNIFGKRKSTSRGDENSGSWKGVKARGGQSGKGIMCEFVCVLFEVWTYV